MFALIFHFRITVVKDLFGEVQIDFWLQYEILDVSTVSTCFHGEAQVQELCLVYKCARKEEDNKLNKTITQG